MLHLCCHHHYDHPHHLHQYDLVRRHALPYHKMYQVNGSTHLQHKRYQQFPLGWGGGVKGRSEIF